MFSRSLIDDRGGVNDTSRNVRMMITSDDTTWCVTYDCRSGDSRGVIYDRNIFILQATER
jgi:hypothetical protein